VNQWLVTWMRPIGFGIQNSRVAQARPPDPLNMKTLPVVLAEAVR